MARQVLLCFLWLGLAATALVDVQKRVLGGSTCGRNERLYHVRLSRDPSGYPLLCGGSLISDRWILTAAHCWNKPLYAVLGVHPGPGQTVQIKEQPVVFKDQNGDHDIMLLKLPSPTKINPVPLPDCSNPLKFGDKVQIAGYAAMFAGYQNKNQLCQAYTLQCADIQVVKCQTQSQIMLCGQTPGVHVCQGDSGGGVVTQRGIYGVISFGATTVCSGTAGIMNVCHKPYFQWITDTIAPKKCFGCG